MKELISIIVPAFNVESNIIECLDSIAFQTYKNIEVIVVDDGSNDKTSTLSQEYCKSHRNFTYYYKSNGGLSSARNYGIDKSNGQYICFVDSDDVINKNFVTCLYEQVKIGDCKICECNMSNNLEEVIKSDKRLNDEIILKSKDWLTEINLNGYLSCCVCNKIYDSSLFKHNRFTKGILHEDEDILYKLVYEAKRIKRIYSKLYYYRQRENSITHTITEQNIIDMINIYEDKIIFFYDNKENQVAEFWKSKFCIYLINKFHLNFIDKNIKREWYIKVCDMYKESKHNVLVPLKYKIFIKLFCLFPWLFKSNILKLRFYKGIT